MYIYIYIYIYITIPTKISKLFVIAPSFVELNSFREQLGLYEMEQLVLTSPSVCYRTANQKFKGWMRRQIFFAHQNQCVLKTYLSPIKVHTEQAM